MSTSQRFNMIVLGVMGLGITFASASSRPWNATPIEIAADYAQIDHQKSSTESINIRWWAPPTVISGTALDGILEKYIVVSVIHFHVNQGGTMSFDKIGTLEARDGGDKPLTLVPRDKLSPVAIGVLSLLEAFARQSAGRIGDAVEFFTFDAGAARACAKGAISIPLAGETYTWETPFPGCSPAPGGTDDGFNCLAPNGSIVDCKDRTRNAMPTVEGTVDSFNCLAPDGSIVDCKDRAR
jgi:hypothetical protein